MEVSQEMEAMLGSSAQAPAANYLLVVAEDMLQQQQQQQAGSAGASSKSFAAAAAAAGGMLGLLAVDAGSGDIAYCLACTGSSLAAQAAASSSSSSSSSEAGCSIMPLEAVLLSLAPADIVVTEPVSAATQQVLLNYMAGASRRCRLEKIQPQQQVGTHGRSQKSSSSAPQAAAGGYLDSALMSDLVDFFSGDTAEAADSGSSKAVAARSSSSKAVAAGAASSDGPGSAAGLAFILSLPQPVLSALAGALAYLKPFGLADVLRCSSSYRALRVGGALELDGSALRQLEVLESGGLMYVDMLSFQNSLTTCADTILQSRGAG
jgi:hypothetical protein